MKNPQCIINGATLFVGGRRWAHGDLWRLGDDAFVFNACMEDGETAWQYDAPPAHARTIEVLDEGRLFERRGVLVVLAKDAELNTVAKHYVGKWATP